MINNDELKNTFEDENDFIIIDKQLQDSKVMKNNKLIKTSLKSQYSSDNVPILTKEELKEILIKENLL